MSELVKLEILEEELLDGTVRYYSGDVKSFPAEKAERWCKLGWAKAVNGEFPTGDRKPGPNGPVVPAKVTTTLT